MPIALILVALFSVSTNAATPSKETGCAPIDLRNESLGEVRDQRELNWCYAYVTADMLAHHYRTPRISAADVAITYNDRGIPRTQRKLYAFYEWLFRRGAPYSEHETGFLKLSLKASLERGACAESDFPSDHLDRISIPAPAASTTVTYREAMQEIHSQRDGLRDKDPTNDEVLRSFRYAIRGVDDATYFKTLSDSSRTKLLFNFTELACDSRRLPPASSDDFRSSRTHGGILKEIDSVLENGELVGFDYLSSFLYAESASKVRIHTSVLVARRSNPETGACEYLVRNSQGPDCARYDPKFPCEKGQLWIPGEVLKPHLIDIAYFLTPSTR